METSVTWNAGKSRFEITVNDDLAGVLEYRFDGSDVEMFHTEIYSEYGGRGLGGTLVRAALDEARTAGWTIIPTCSFVQRFIGRHPEYQDLTA